jgi:ribonuclease P protein component
MHHHLSFPKNEHLCLKSTFDELFLSRKALYYNGFKIVWMAKETEKTSVQVAFSVSKRNFKRAVRRNILKRRIREAYRLHKSPFIQTLIENNLSLSFIFIYTLKEIKEYREIEENVIHSLTKLEHELAKWKQNNSNNSLAITNGSDTVD